jgi:hypothetical protein
MSITPARINLRVYQGSTFKETFRWESQTKAYVSISNISKEAPCVITTSSIHSIPAGWRFRVTDVLGMNQINQPSEDQFYLANSVTNNTITINNLNSSNFNTYTSGGTISYNVPVGLNNFTGLFQMRENINSPTVLKQLTSAPGQGIVIDNTNKIITITISAADTTTFDFSSAVYGLELTSGSGEVFPLITGTISLVKEIVR